jgi:hypothetical protein
VDGVEAIAKSSFPCIITEKPMGIMGYIRKTYLEKIPDDGKTQ